MRSIAKTLRGYYGAHAARVEFSLARKSFR